MGFERKWPEHVQKVMVARVVVRGERPKHVHALALGGGIPGIEPHEVPPLPTLQKWCTEARKEQAAENDATTLQGHTDSVERTIARVAIALDRKAAALIKSGNWTPEEMTKIAKAAGECAKARRELERGNARPNPSTPDSPGTPDTAPQDARGFLDGLDPDAD